MFASWVGVQEGVTLLEIAQKKGFKAVANAIAERQGK